MSEGEGPVFYRIDSSRFTMRESSWGTKNPLVLAIAGAFKLLRVNLGGSTDDPPVERLQPFEVASLPDEVRSKFEPIAYELQALGFTDPVYHLIIDPLNFTTHYWATFRHVAGNAFARIHNRIWTKPHPPREHLFPYFVSAFSDGTFLFSSSGKPDVLEPPGTIAQRMQGATLAALWQAHEARLQKAGKTIYQLLDEGALRWAIDAYHAATRDFHIKRGAFKNLTAEDRRDTAMLQQARASNSPNADVLAEIDLLQNGSSSWKNSIGLLIITGIAFIALGGIQNSFQTALLLIPILLFHEAGHYLAMHIFKYRNLKMFFIPLFGAAVSGRSFNAPGWKKVVVLLMGPVPGILLGSALIIAGGRRESEWALKAGQMLIWINGFNLLPLLPLDGGRVVGVILFSRHYILDTVFRAVTAVGIMLLGFGTSSQLLMVVGIFSLVALGTSVKLARITEKIRGLKLPMVANDGETIPIETADVIISEVKQKFPKGLNTKNIAEHTLTVFETLNSRPPNWLASIFFLGVHGFIFLLAFAMLGVSDIRLRQVSGFSGAPPRSPIATASIKTWSGPQANFQVRTQATSVIATFKKRPQAERLFGELSRTLPKDCEEMLFGDTLFVRMPATNLNLRSRTYQQCAKFTTNCFVERANYGAALKLGFTVAAKDQRSGWFEELEHFFESHSSYELIPPWAPDAAWPGTNRAEFIRARRTLFLLTQPEMEDSGSGGTAAKKFEEEIQQIAEAQRAGDDEKVKALRDDRRRRAEAAEKARLESIRKMPETQVHAGVIDTYMKYPSDTNGLAAYHRSQKELESLLGSLRGAKPEWARYRLTGGYLLKKQDKIAINGIEFENIFFNAPELIHWLEIHGVKDLKYRVEGRSSIYDISEEGDAEEN